MNARPSASPPAAALALAALLLLAAVPAAAQIAVGTKEVVIDSVADFAHTSGSQIKLWKGNERVLDVMTGADPIGYFYDKADLSDPNLMLYDQTNGYISKITTQQRPTPNSIPPEVGELRLAGWKSTRVGDRVVATSSGISAPDDWNTWAGSATAGVHLTGDPATFSAPDRPSLPVGGLNYILQSFKVYKTGLLDKLRLKVRRHPGVSPHPTHPGLYVVILADDGTQKNPKTYVSGSVIKEVVLGYAHVPDSKIADSSPIGQNSFETLDVVFTGVNRPMLVADKLYWMKITTMPYSQ